MAIVKIVSGGQTGADRGGLDAAIYCRVPHGGWCPKGRKAEDGRIPDKYHLDEMKSANYLRRTEQNVMDTDATLVFTLGRASGGSLRTLEYAHGHEKPWLHIDVDEMGRERAVKAVVEWLTGKDRGAHDNCGVLPPEDCVLNVAGSRESKADGIQDLVASIMVDVLRELNPECRSLYPLP